MITLHCVPSLTLPTDIAMHRVVIIPRRPPFVCEAVRQLQTCLRYVGLPAFSSRTVTEGKCAS
jgi:hypothetical protein